MARLFISQEYLDSPNDEVTLDGDRLTVANLGTFQIGPAVRFLKVAGDEADPYGLINSVRTEDEIAEMGGDLYMNSVIHGDIAYDVEVGFLGTLQASPD